MTRKAEKDVEQFGFQRNHQEKPWIGVNLIVILFDPRMEPEQEQLAQTLEALGYYGYKITKEKLYQLMMDEDSNGDEDL